MQVKGIPLIKFQNEDKIKKLQDGLVYMNTLEWYRKHENLNGNMVIGDSFEGMLHFNDAELFLPDLGETISLNGDLMKTTHSNDYAFCMFGVNPNLMTFKFTEKQKKEMLSFGDTALLILDSDEFIKRIDKAAKEKGYKLYKNFVKYFDEHKDHVDIFMSLMLGGQNIAFWKRASYAYQNEFRFVINAENLNDEHLELDIGNIKDISAIMKTSSILNAEVFRRKGD